MRSPAALVAPLHPPPWQSRGLSLKLQEKKEKYSLVQPKYLMVSRPLMTPLKIKKLKLVMLSLSDIVAPKELRACPKCSNLLLQLWEKA